MDRTQDDAQAAGFAVYADINGTAGDDNLVGTANPETINGLAGDDTIDGLGGADVLNGNEGSDTFALTSLDDGEVINGGSDTAPTPSATVSFDESVDGDLSDDRANPDAITLGLGANTVSATQDGSPRDLDYLTFTVEAGQELSAINLTNYVAGSGNLAFLGIQQGDEFTVDPFAPSATDLLGGITYGSGNVGDDILQTMGSLGGAIGFSGPLAAGDYTLWFNQTSEESTVTIELVTSAVAADPTADTLDLSGVTGLSEGVSVDLDENFSGRSAPGLSQDGFVQNFDTINGGDQTFFIDLVDIENVIGTNQNDRLFGNEEDNILRGGAGDDIIHPFDGTDVVDGGEGVDLALFAQAKGALTVDLAAGTAGPNTLISIENFTGGIFNDTISGDDGDNVLNGNAGDDVINGLGGNDTLIGGAGADELNGGSGVDTADYSASAQGVTVRLFRDGPHSGGDAQGDTTDSIEAVIGSAFDDSLASDLDVDVTLDGGAGNDMLNGVNGTGVDTLLGGAGDDTLAARQGDDILDGGEGVDTLFGDGGDDVLNGGAGADSLTGGAGSDTFAFNGDAFDGNDVSAAGRQIVGDEDFITDFNFDRDVYELDAADFAISGDVDFLALDANADGATIAAGKNVIVLLNSDNDDDDHTPFLAGTAANQIADLVDTDGAGFFVYFNSNLGVNRLAYSTNLNDASADLKIVSRQTDLVGQDAIDALADFSADNFTFANVDATDDTLVVSSITDGQVIDLGAETIEIANEPGDIVTGDTIDLSGASAAANVDLDAFNQAALNPVEPTQEGVLTIGADTATLINVENVIGTDFGDVLFGNQENNVILGGDGDDNIHPFGGTDFVDGGAGVDTLNLSAATGVTVDLETTTVGPNTFINFENVLGSVNGDDTLLGDAGVNSLNGRAGDDVLDGRGGADTLIGDAGNDTFALSTSDDGETLDGGADDNVSGASSAADIVTGDTLDLSGLDLTDVESIFVDLDEVNQAALNGNPPPTQDGVLRVTRDGVESTIDVQDVENIIGSSAGETLFGNQENNVILGGDGDDNIHPFGGTDFVDGGAGVDTLNLSAATGVTVDLEVGVVGTNTFANFENVLGSVNGDDVIRGDVGDNVLNGRDGDDVIAGREGADTLIGGEGDDTADYSESAQGVDVRLFRDVQARGDAEGDTLEGFENVIGSAFDDRLVGGGGVATTLDGGDGDDDVFGVDLGGETLIGGAGNDVIDGRGGSDTLTGGTGADAFVFASGSDGDVITDFTDGEDLFDLSGSLATSFADLTVVDLTGVGSIVTGYGAADDLVLLEGVSASLIDATDFVF